MITKNNRKFTGKLAIVDYECNIILHETIAEIPKELNCPLNYDLENYLDFNMPLTQFDHLPEEEKKKAKY